jgi:hypothetical protein
MNPKKWENGLNNCAHQAVVPGHPMAMHCHHYNINLQKTLENTLGQTGIDLLYSSAEEAVFHYFKSHLSRYPMIRSVKSKLEMAAVLYQNCGMGIIHFERADHSRWRIVSPSSHFVTGWLAKHGRRDTPGCHFSRGWIAGTLAVVFNLPAGRFQVHEKNCKMMRDEVCAFYASLR